MRKRMAMLTVALALIWAGLMIAASLILAGTDYYARLSPLFIGGWVTSWLLTRGLAAGPGRAGQCCDRPATADAD